MVAAFEKSLFDMTSQLQKLASVDAAKESELRQLRAALDALKAESRGLLTSTSAQRVSRPTSRRGQPAAESSGGVDPSCPIHHHLPNRMRSASSDSASLGGDVKKKKNWVSIAHGKSVPETE